MATIPMTSGFKIVPEGTHVFRIYNVEYDPAFGKLVMFLVTAQGITHREYFNFLNGDGSSNDKAYSMFSIIAKTALDNHDLEEIDHTDIINHYFKADVTHTKNAEGTKTYLKFNNCDVATAFDTEPTEKALTLGTTPAPAPAENKNVDLASLLG